MSIARVSPPLLFAALLLPAVLPAFGCSSNAEQAGPGDDAGVGVDAAIVAEVSDLAAFTPIDGFAACGDIGCPGTFACKYSLCVPNLGACGSSGDCPGDSYCDTDSTCVPYGVPPSKVNDPTCTKSPTPAGVQPTVKCEWKDATDTTAGYNNIYTTPVVANLNLGNDLNQLHPSIVVTTFKFVGNSRTGMLRVFDGRTCAEQMHIGGPDDPTHQADYQPAYGTQWAIGDLDGDVGTAAGHPEIVGLHRIGNTDSLNDPLTLIAFKVDTTTTPGTPKLAPMWTGKICGVNGAPDTPITSIANITNAANFGPGLWDLDDDGKPEVVLDKLVFDHNGCLLNPPATVNGYITHGVISTVADVDLDGKPDLVSYDGVYGWDTTAKNWVKKSYFAPTDAVNATLAGHVAVADFGHYSAIPGHPATDALPEIVVVSAAGSDTKTNGTIRVMTLTGELIFGPMVLFHQNDGVSTTTQFGGHGGPPTIGDFDGDGYVEFAAAANQFYTVYDLDCFGAAPAQRPNGKCDRTGVKLPTFVPSLPNGVLWAAQSQDFSSSETGSSIFDFDGDGVAEAVYRDECYVRVYDGRNGNVKFSAPASSGTGQELPVIADVGGTFTTQIVVPRSNNGSGCPATDPLNANSGTFATSTGFEVLSDPMDRWVSSRAIWNQHAYSVTNVGDNGEIPRSSLVKNNWQQPGLNNFRQNVQGALGKLLLANFTVELTDLAAICKTAGAVTLTARVCNRGTNPAPDGVAVAFSSVSGDGGADTPLCSTTTPTTLQVGDCTQVSCVGTISDDANIFVTVDPDNTIADCHPNNKRGAGSLLLCPPPIG
jgi:hypothetical protein